MANTFLTATQIHDGYTFLEPGTIIEVADDGTIVALHPQGSIEGAVFYDGIIAPGFVNAHCHLELSHLQDMVPEATGLIPFLQQIPAQRNNFTDEQKKAARHAAYQYMVQQGIVAAGDIANSNETLDIRLLDDLHLHTFVECIGFTEQFAAARLAYSTEVRDAFAAQQSTGKELRQSVIPHAPYSVSGTLFQLINDAAPGSLISIHNQESPAEDEFYKLKTGNVLNLLNGLGINYDFFTPTGKSSLQSYLPYFTTDHPLLLVHNTYTTAEDMVAAQANGRTVSWCLCPNANWYIERRLPDVNLLMQYADNICIGTDSLASNHQLSVLDELVTLKQHFPKLEWETLLRWATANGAKALQMDKMIGSISAGKKPGLLLLQGLDNNRPVIRPLLR